MQTVEMKHANSLSRNPIVLAAHLAEYFTEEERTNAYVVARSLAYREFSMFLKLPKA